MKDYSCVRQKYFYVYKKYKENIIETLYVIKLLDSAIKIPYAIHKNYLNNCVQLDVYWYVGKNNSLKSIINEYQLDNENEIQKKFILKDSYFYGFKSV